MAAVSDPESAVRRAAANPRSAPVAALLAGVVLVLTARVGPVAMLAGIAVVQAALALVWVFGTALPGRIGALVIAVLAAAGADVAVALWPHGELGTLLIVFALAVPVMFVHQLVRGAARVRVVDSLGAIAVLVFAEVALPALYQLRHEFIGTTTGGRVVAAAVAAMAGGLVVGRLIDMVVPAPRFDADVPRGLLAVIASALCGAAIGYLMLRDVAEFIGGRGAFAGAALGALVGLLTVGVGFAEHASMSPASGFGRHMRPLVGILLPLAVLAPVAYVLCLAIRG